LYNSIALSQREKSPFSGRPCKAIRT